jgi:hypothetical protein
MARKRKKLQGLDYNSTEYWNRLLNQEGLSISRGKSERLLYIGGTSEVERLGGFLSTMTGRIAPHDVDGPDDDKE